MKYDYLVVGAGLYGASFAERMHAAGKRVLVLEKRNHTGGNAYTELIEGIQVHKYGAHIFHTNNKKVWDYINQFASFNRFTNSPIANYRGQLFSLPFNMYTFYKMWGCATPQEAKDIIQRQREEAGVLEPANLEEQALSLVGRDIYNTLIKGYTEKQWGRDCKDLPAFIIQRLPVRFSFDNNYFSAQYQGIPIGGYTKMINNMLEGIETRLGEDFFERKEYWEKCAEKIVFSGPVDRFFDYCYGPLAYRSLRFEEEIIDCANYQGNAVVNYTDRETPYTRIIEHKFFDPVETEKTVISREYSVDWTPGMEAFYPINDHKNTELYEKYRLLAEKEQKYLFGGRLGEYRYYDMDAVIERALLKVEEELR